MVNPFDVSISHFVNHFAHRSWFFDTICTIFDKDPLLRSGPVIAGFWYMWFRRGSGQHKSREIVVSAMVLSCFSVVLARVLAALLPFRERPLSEASLNFILPYSISRESLIGWSSFPSDHAVLYICLATCLYFCSRKIGILAYIYTVVFILIPRLYLGYHYATDILVGVLLGVGCGSLVLLQRPRALVARWPLRWVEEFSGPFYAVFFLAWFSVATNFDSWRFLASVVWHALRAHIGHA